MRTANLIFKGKIGLRKYEEILRPEHEISAIIMDEGPKQIFEETSEKEGFTEEKFMKVNDVGLSDPRKEKGA
jgi:hypothetical protein